MGSEKDNVKIRRKNRRPQVVEGMAPQPGLEPGTLGQLNSKYFTGLETDPPTKMEEQYDAVLYLGPVRRSRGRR